MRLSSDLCALIFVHESEDTEAEFVVKIVGIWAWVGWLEYSERIRLLCEMASTS